MHMLNFSFPTTINKSTQNAPKQPSAFQYWCRLGREEKKQTKKEQFSWASSVSCHSAGSQHNTQSIYSVRATNSSLAYRPSLR